MGVVPAERRRVHEGYAVPAVLGALAVLVGPQAALTREVACPRADAYGSEATGERGHRSRRTALAARGARRFGAVRLAVLVSGTGSILEAMLGVGLPVDLVGADRPCRGLGVAADAGIETVLVARGKWMMRGTGEDAVIGGNSAVSGNSDLGQRRFDREGYSRKLAAVLAGRGVDVVAMAGFGTVLDGSFFEWGDGRYRGRVLNTHPSLLPAFPGWHAVRDALDAGATESGCTVHVAIPEVDAGPVLAQQAVPVLAGDDEATLHERIKATERELYPATIAAFVERCASDECRHRSDAAGLDGSGDVGEGGLGRREAEPGQKGQTR